MIKTFITVLIILPLLFSCSKKEFSNLYNDGSYKEVYSLASTVTENKLDSTALYYKALSANRLGYNEESVKAAYLFVLLNDGSSDEKTAMERIILHYGEKEEALEVGKLLYSEGKLTKDDSIQYYKVLNDNRLYSNANDYLNELYMMLSDSEYLFCLINGGAELDIILEALNTINLNSGTSESFLTSIRMLLTKIDEPEEVVKLSRFFDKTFDGNTKYALIIGDFYFDHNNSAKMLYYWDIAKKDFPEAVKVRRSVSNSN